MDSVDGTISREDIPLPTSSHDDSRCQSALHLDATSTSSDSHVSNKRPHSPESQDPPSSSSSAKTAGPQDLQDDASSGDHQVSRCADPQHLCESVSCDCPASRASQSLNKTRMAVMEGTGHERFGGHAEISSISGHDESTMRHAASAGKASSKAILFDDGEGSVPHTPQTSIESSSLLTNNPRQRSSSILHTSALWSDRDLTHLASSHILNRLKCTSCHSTLVDPITLPCGHSMCMQCVHRRTRQQRSGSSSPQHVSATSSSLFVPPRLPLTSLTVPCGDDKCPRAAIGQGLGLWTGEVAIYGICNRHNSHRLSASSGLDEAGALPIDGFIVGVPDHSLRLTVIPAQLRSESHLFAYAVEPDAGQAADSLRVDVTLSKALSLLRQALRKDLPSNFTNFGDNAPAGPSRSTRPDSLTRQNWQRGRPSSRRWNRAPRIPIMGRYEEELESGTVGAVQAVSDSEGDDEPSQRAGAWGGHPFDDEDGGFSDARDVGGNDTPASYDSDASYTSAISSAWPDDIGGAYARAESYRRVSRGWQEDAELSGRQFRNKSKRRRRNTNHAVRGSRTSIGGSRHVRHPSADDDWDTVESGPTSAVSSNRHTRQSQASSSRSPAPPVANVWNQLVNRFDRGERIDIADATVQTHVEPTVVPPPAIVSPSSGCDVKERSVPASGNAQCPSLDSLYCDLVDVLECHVCYLLAYEPITSPCGHSLCRTCLARSLDHSDRCPLCRAQLPTFAFYQDHRPNAGLTEVCNSEVELPAAAPDFQVKAIQSENGHPTTSKWGLQSLFLERKATVEEERRLARLSTPIFVCTLAFPGMPTILHIFEPRYRLMVRRCLESGNPRFGMVLPSNDASSPVPGLNEYGTMLEIRSVQMLPDGRSLIETVGTHRFRLLDRGSIDGYTVGQIERFDDISPAAERALEAAALMQNRRQAAASSADTEFGGTSGATDSTTASEPICAGMATAMRGSMSPQPPGSVEGSTSVAGVEDSRVHVSDQPVQTTQELVDVCIEFIELVKSGSAPWLMSRLNSTYGPMPEPIDVERFSYWMALVIPIDEHEKAKLLPIRSPRLRLCLVVQWIEKLRESWWFTSGCTIN